MTIITSASLYSVVGVGVLIQLYIIVCIVVDVHQTMYFYYFITNKTTENYNNSKKEEDEKERADDH